MSKVEDGSLAKGTKSRFVNISGPWTRDNSSQNSSARGCRMMQKWKIRLIQLQDNGIGTL